MAQVQAVVDAEPDDDDSGNHFSDAQRPAEAVAEDAQHVDHDAEDGEPGPKPIASFIDRVQQSAQLSKYSFDDPGRKGL